MLNEKFEEFVTKEKVIIEAHDPMPTVQASIIPGTGSDPSAVSDVQTAKAGGKDPAPTVQPGVAIGQKAAADLGGSTSAPLHSNDEDGAENPGAKASAPISQISGDPQYAHAKSAGDPAPTVNVAAAYGITKMGGNVTYPIKAGFEIDMTDDVNALLEGTELSPEFAVKAKTIFEAAVTSKLSEEYDRLVEHFATESEKQVEAVKAELSEEVSGTVNYAIGQWMETNQVAIDRGIRNEITEDFIAGLKGLFEEHYISIPDDKIDVVEGMTESIREMEQCLDEQVKANVKLQNRLNETAKLNILNTVSEGLADTQKEKLAALSESLEFVSEEDFSRKVKTIKEAYFRESITTPTEVSDETPVEGQEVTPAMAQYLRALNNWSN